MAASVESNLCEPFENPVEVMESRAEEAARLLSALGQSKRLMVLCRLVDNEMSVGALAESVGLGQSALSQHLAVLRDEHLVRTRREAQTIYYSLMPGPAAAVIETLHRFYCNARADTGHERGAA